LKRGSLNLLEATGPIQGCTETVSYLPLVLSSDCFLVRSGYKLRLTAFNTGMIVDNKFQKT